MEHQFQIDLVFTWVNAEDPEWQKLYEAYAPAQKKDGSSRSRFHNRDELKYALRSWDLYAPFIRKVFIVSNCAPPEWLDLDNKRVVWVPHEDIFPESALPTFSSHAIETRLHHIPGLSDHFIYSNDDFLLTRQAYASDFYFPSGIAKVRLEPYGMVIGEPKSGRPDYLNGAINANALLEGVFERSTTQLVTHSPQPMLKDVLKEIEERFEEHITRTTHNKFRAVDDVAVTGYLHAHFAILIGRAVYDQTPVQLIQQNHKFEEIFSRLVRNKREGGRNPLSICVNDGADSHLNKSWNVSLLAFLDEFYPNKSSFEKVTT
nr:stealth conserved region 3 domain-containing protein [Nitratireductor aquimarinus]